ncbi:hypothetical protein ABLA30_14200 [Xenorhabdus nematophila]|uniref:hypothetical protein n=1 Tax=Xenorhabdus nematophila TaxID=628 RepID=UPI0003275A9D|nr:hypothetical protein [Xenorhabdus nematophila]CCW30760.1 conserved hypothetical protein [Xenorhabdus nematophila F1]
MGDFFGLAINQIAQFGLSSLPVIYYLEQLFSLTRLIAGERAKPELSINVKELGGMYADRIWLTSTENGVGVNLRNLKSPEIHAGGNGATVYVATNGSEDMKKIHFYGDDTTKIFIDGVPY